MHTPSILPTIQDIAQQLSYYGHTATYYMDQSVNENDMLYRVFYNSFDQVVARCSHVTGELSYNVDNQQNSQSSYSMDEDAPTIEDINYNHPHGLIAVFADASDPGVGIGFLDENGRLVAHYYYSTNDTVYYDADENPINDEEPAASLPTVMIDLRQCIISPAIVTAVQSYNPDWNSAPFIRENDGAFGLSRMPRMMTANFDTLITSEPVELRIKRASSGNPQGKTIDGARMQLYTIANGRHRIARALIEGHGTINATIID